jgi:hypothetical protein
MQKSHLQATKRVRRTHAGYQTRPKQMQSLLADWFRAIYWGRMHICNQPIREQKHHQPCITTSVKKN